MEKNFNVDGVTIEQSSTGLSFINIKTKYCTCAITTNGAHVTEFTPTGEKPVLWMSKSSNLTLNSALRGGVPVCAPWFGPAPVVGRPNHGIVRTQIWEIEEISQLVGMDNCVIFGARDEELVKMINNGEIEYPLIERIEKYLLPELKN